MTDINSQIAKYLQSTGSEANISDVTEKLKNLANSINWKETSIFSYGEDATEDELLEFMSKATGKDSDEISDDVSLLFNVLNAGSDDDVLSTDELEMMESKSQGGVSAFGFWNNMISNISESDVQSYIQETSSSSDSSSVANSSSVSASNETLADTTATTADDIASKLQELYKELSNVETQEERYEILGRIEELISNDKTAQNETETTDEADNTTAATTKTANETETTDDATDTSEDTEISKMKNKIYQIIIQSDTDNYTCPEDVIKELEDSGKYTQEFIDELRGSYLTYSEEDETKINAKLSALQLLDENATRADAIAALEENQELGSPITDVNTELTEVMEYTLDEVKDMIYNSIISSDTDNYTCPEDVIKELEDSGKYTEEFIEELRTSYITYSDTDEEKINAELIKLQLTNPDATREDAIASLGSEIGDPITDSTTELYNSGPSITEETADHNANKLYNALKGNNTGFFFGWGTNEEAIDQVFNDDTLTSADWVKILLSYSEINSDSEVNSDSDSEGNKSRALVSDIDWDFADGSAKQTEYYEKIVDSLLSEIDAGNEDAIIALCQQIYGATAGQTGTANEFMEILFDKIGDETLALVVEKYSDVTGSDITTDITKDYHKVIGTGANKTGREYLSRIDDAINKYGRE